MDLQVLADELNQDPLGRGYAGMTDFDAAADISTEYRDGAADGNALVQYSLVEVHRTNTGTDLERLTIYSRIKRMSEAAENDDVFGAAPLLPASETDISAATTFMRLLDTDAQTVLTNLNDNRYAQLLDALAAAHVMAHTQADDMKAFSQNQRSRGQELGLGIVREGHVAQARAL